MVALAVFVLATTSGCPMTPVERAGPTAASSFGRWVPPARPTDASIGQDAYAGPPADAPPSAGSVSTVRAAVDLTPGIPKGFGWAEAVVAAPDGGAYVAVRSLRKSLPPALVTVGAV